MVFVPNDVKCVVCKRIFCCSKCRQKHETEAHEISEIIAHKNSQKCSLCKGYPTLRLELVNDFDFLTHLCHHHLPLHCRKCSKEFKTANDFRDKSKCVNTSENCRLEILENDLKNLKMTSFYGSNKNLSDVNYVTASGNLDSDTEKLSDNNQSSAPAGEPATKCHLWHHKSTHLYKSSVSIKNSSESMISDSVLSLRNCSSILHASSTNHTIYKSNSPNDATENIVRQTSTPMHQNMKIVRTPDSITCSCSASSSVCHMSSINGDNSSESDTSPGLQIEANVQQKSIESNSAQRRTSLGRSGRAKLPLAATPLRQVMSKSIQRAIREHVAGSMEKFSPLSPLDLRMSPVIRRCQRDTIKPQQQQQHSPNEPDSGNEFIKTPLSTKQNQVEKPLSNESRRTSDHFTNLETVYESTKNTEPFPNDECNDQNEINKNLEISRITTECSNEIIITYSSHNEFEIKETPVSRNSNGTDGNVVLQDSTTGDVWYTPTEMMSIKANETDEIYTPVLKITNWPLKRHSTRHKENIEVNSQDTNENAASVDHNEQAASRSGRNKLWSLVSTVFGFGNSGSTENGQRSILSHKNETGKTDMHAVTVTPNNSMNDSSINSYSPFIIKRCASFAGVLSNRQSSQEDSHLSQEFQPNKRRRTSTVNGPVNETTSNRYACYRRIKGRPPIQRMRETN